MTVTLRQVDISLKKLVNILQKSRYMELDLSVKLLMKGLFGLFHFNRIRTLKIGGFAR